MAQPKAANWKLGDYQEHTPSGAILGGVPTLVGGIVGVPPSDIAASAVGNLQIEGQMKIVCDNSVGNVGDNLWWDSDGDPVGGTAGTGAATTEGYSGNFWLGRLVAATAAADTHAYCQLNEPNLTLPYFPNFTHEVKTGTYSVDAQDTNKVLHDLTDGAVITLPVTALGDGMIVVVQNDGADAAVGISIDPAAADAILGPDLTGTANKDLINTKATAIRGDYVVLEGGHADGWFVREKRGIWAAEA